MLQTARRGFESLTAHETVAQLRKSAGLKPRRSRFDSAGFTRPDWSSCGTDAGLLPRRPGFDSLIWCEGDPVLRQVSLESPSGERATRLKGMRVDPERSSLGVRFQRNVAAHGGFSGTYQVGPDGKDAGP